ncbi:MAG TPA: hypothetical protein VD996_08445 [Chitinophagaceae bacterium]|nr:hypothetical protein [Chitinophagaceae bacterium]
MKRVALLLTLAIAFASCQKDLDFETSTGGNNTGEDTYQPITKGSYWKYKDSAFTGQTTLMTVTGQTKTINGKSYHVISSEATGQPAVEGYFYVNKPVYGVRGEVPGGQGVLDYTHLNDTASVGYTWTDDMGIIAQFPARFTGEIIERGISKVVEGKTYNDVIHTRLELEYELPIFGWTSFGSYEYYIAKNIGIIRIESNVGFAGVGVTTVMNLIEYSIK